MTNTQDLKPQSLPLKPQQYEDALKSAASTIKHKFAIQEDSAIDISNNSVEYYAQNLSQTLEYLFAVGAIEQVLSILLNSGDYDGYNEVANHLFPGNGGMPFNSSNFAVNTKLDQEQAHFNEDLDLGSSVHLMIEFATTLDLEKLHQEYQMEEEMQSTNELYSLFLKTVYTIAEAVHNQEKIINQNKLVILENKLASLNDDDDGENDDDGDNDLSPEILDAANKLKTKDEEISNNGGAGNGKHDPIHMSTKKALHKKKSPLTTNPLSTNPYHNNENDDDETDGDKDGDRPHI